MAIWQYDIHLAPREALVARHGTLPCSVTAFLPMSDEAYESGSFMDEAGNEASYWADHQALHDECKTMLQSCLDRAPSWHEDLSAWGVDGGNQIQICPDDVHCTFDVRLINVPIISNIISVSRKLGLMFIDGKSGYIFEADINAFMSNLLASRAFAFVCNPWAVLSTIKPASGGGS